MSSETAPDAPAVQTEPQAEAVEVPQQDAKVFFEQGQRLFDQSKYEEAAFVLSPPPSSSHAFADLEHDSYYCAYTANSSPKLLSNSKSNLLK